MFIQRPSLAAHVQRIATRGRRPPPPLRPWPFVNNKTQVLHSTPSLPKASSSSNTTSTLQTDSATEAETEFTGRYFVNRSEGGKLPVYSKIRNGGSITTIVRKVDILQKDLNTYLAKLHIDPFTSPPKVTVRPTNQHLQIKGHWVEEVKGWLEGRGF
ncbi:hypothetical protein I316_05524 [Kwoniella heveanensis BCC8398]|uniref:Large ribosomal subunit protein mL49 n=1 Tax=Kwoniella heveanensis BCC8398 TaxID=1296120 RepID=A0A1B9GPE4_9TREE|nr:hypothetical protein I316_05524 [Kwoniella heveanensis BCC8398]